MTATAIIGVEEIGVEEITVAPRGFISDKILRTLRDGQPLNSLLGAVKQAVQMSTDIVRDDDIQVSLFVLYALHYGSLKALPAEREWDPQLIEARQVLETAFERELRARVTVPSLPAPEAPNVAKALFTLTAPSPGPSTARFIAKEATLQQAREFLKHRTIYTLREADPHSWAIPRLTGRAKAALVEIQSDEYGGGRPERVHATLFATTLRGVGLDYTYGAYINEVPAITIASHNLMSLFGLNRRLIGAIAGHLAAFEMTSSLPSRMLADGFRRLGFGDDVTEYFDEHVEADAVHEQIAATDLAGTLAEDQPEALADIMFGAAACLAVDGWVGDHLLEAWKRGASSLREIPSKEAYDDETNAEEIND